MQPKDRKPPKLGGGLSFPLQMLLGFVLIGGLVYGIPWLLERLDRAWWLLPALLLATPLAAVILDMAQGNLKPTLFNGLFAYLGYVFRAGYMLVIMLGSVGFLFLIGPVWLAGIFFTIIDVVTRILPTVQAADVPILCGWAGIEAPYCIPALLAYHAISAILVFLVVRYGNRLTDYAVGWYQQGSEWFARQIES